MNTRLLLCVTFLLSAWPLLAAEDPTHALRTTADVTWIAFTPDSKQLLTSGDAVLNLGDEFSYELRLWSVETGKLVAKTMKSSGVGASGTVSPDGRLALTGGTGGEWRLWKLPELTFVRKGQLDNMRIDRVAFRPDGKAFAALLRDGPTNKNGVKYKAFAFDTANGRPTGEPVNWSPERPKDFPVGRPLTGPPAGWTARNDPTFDKDGVLVAPTSIDPLEVPGDEGCGGPLARAISRDGKRAVSAGCNGRVVVWDYPARKVIGKPLAAFGALGVSDPGLAISADGRLAAVASMANVFNGNILSLTVYDLDTRKVVLGPLKIGTLGVGLVNALAFRPDGSMLAIAFSRRGGDIQQPSTEVQLWAIPAEK